MKIRPWLCALLMGSVLVGLTACSDSSAEVDALRTQVEELQERLDAASVNASAATTTPATTRAPAATTTQVRFTAKEESWIENELSDFDVGWGITRFQSRCILQGFVEGRGVTKTEELLERVDAELNSGGLLSASDADAFLEPVAACVDLVGITLLDIERTDSRVDASCMVSGLQESQVADWYRTAYVEGEEVARAAMDDFFISRSILCMTTTTTRAPATTTLAPQSPHTFSRAEVASLTNACPTVADLLKDPSRMALRLGEPEACRKMVQSATGMIFSAGGTTFVRECNYEKVKRWVRSGLFTDAEWPLIVERECG